MRSWELGDSFLIVQSSARGEAYGKCLSVFPTHFDVGVFSVIQCVGIMQLVSGFFSKRIVPYIAAYLSILGRRETQEPPMSPSWSKPKINILPSAFEDYFNQS